MHQYCLGRVCGGKLESNHSAQIWTGCAEASCTWKQASKKLDGIPAKWCNKQELFRLLAQCAASIHSGEKQVVSSHGHGVLSTLPFEDVSRLAPCTQEEADTRMFLLVADAVKSGFVRIVVRSVGTDVLVLAVALVQKLQEQTQESIQLWVAFGTGTNLRYLPAHEIASALALPAFHVFSGCDTVSCFFGKSKKTALETWNSFVQITPIFIALSSSSTSIHDDWMQVLERCVVLLYDRTSRCLTVDEA